jgi:hypothetical protein
MAPSPASASGDQPPARTGLTAGDAASRELTVQDLAARLDAPGELTAEDIAALTRLDDGPDAGTDRDVDDPEAGTDPDDRTSPSARINPEAGTDPDDRTNPSARINPEAGTDPDAPMPSDDELAALLDGEPARTAVPEALEAGFTHNIPTPGATGFTSGGPLDVMLAGSDLAWHAAQARRRGLGELSDSELCGIMGAAHRLESWAAGLKLAAVNELDVRRAGADGRPGEHDGCQKQHPDSPDRTNPRRY